MKNLWNRIVPLELAPYASIGKWSSGVLVLEGLYRFVIANHPHLAAWKYVVAAVLLGLSLVQMAIAVKVRRNHRMDPFSSPLELGENLLQATCALGSAFCAWTGVWSLVFCFCGISLFCGISHLTRARYRQGYTLLLPLVDNEESKEENQHAARPVWMYLRIDGDGVDIRPYKERPGSLAEDPMSRILVEYRENQFRILAWPEGISIGGDSEVVEVLVADVTGFTPPPMHDV